MSNIYKWKREDLKIKYNLPDNAYLLNEIIHNWNNKSDKYKNLYKITPLNLIDFEGILNKKEEKKKIEKNINNNNCIDKVDFFDMNNENNFTVQSFELFSKSYKFKFLMKIQRMT